MNNSNTANIANVTKKVKTTVELVKGIDEQGVELEYLAIDGEKLGVLGYSSQKDRENALKFVQSVVDNSSNTGMALYQEVMTACMTGAAMTQEGIKAKDSEEIEIEDIPVIINYEKKKAYFGMGTELTEIANLDDLECELPEEAIKALLVERAKKSIHEFNDMWRGLAEGNGISFEEWIESGT